MRQWSAGDTNVDLWRCSLAADGRMLEVCLISKVTEDSPLDSGVSEAPSLHQQNSRS